MKGIHHLERRPQRGGQCQRWRALTPAAAPGADSPPVQRLRWGGSLGRPGPGACSGALWRCRAAGSAALQAWEAASDRWAGAAAAAALGEAAGRPC